jgi:hypothetical protein
MGRQEIRQEKRKNFWLYIDEFHNFICPSMSSIISGARKYRLGLVLAHQEWRQLETRDPDVASAVLTSNTRVCFRLGDQDAKKLESGFSFFDAGDLQKLEVGEAICRIGRSDFDFNLTTKLIPVVDLALAEERKQKIIDLSRQKYAFRTNAETAQTPPEKLSPIVEIPVSKPSKKEKTSSPGIIRQGRGGREHKHFQYLIEQHASGLGFRADIEKAILGGKGIVDVALEKGECSVACQICVTTPIDQEASNVKKCLLAGFSHVAMICADPQKLGSLKKLILEQISEEETKRIGFFSPEAFLPFVQKLAEQSITLQNTVHGYRVKVNYRSGNGHSVRQEVVSDVILNAIKKIRATKKEGGVDA